MDENRSLGGQLQCQQPDDLQQQYYYEVSSCLHVLTSSRQMNRRSASHRRAQRTAVSKFRLLASNNGPTQLWTNPPSSFLLQSWKHRARAVTSSRCKKSFAATPPISPTMSAPICTAMSSPFA